MIIKRLKLRNWRGVINREVQLSDAVTLIEGPNEIGKSTIVEAIRVLFSTLDSSNKKEIKAIQPVGKDLGSEVEAEILTGEYHFTYGKSFNKNKQSYLHIHSPSPEQMTGRDAHDRAEQILNETVDMALWDALLVEQGKEVTGAYLADSRGLARALDQAAGSSSAQLDDSDLLTAAQLEFEKYFTLKSEKPKFSDLQNELTKATELADEARQALAAVEQDATDHESCSVEIRRLNTEMPKLAANVEKHESEWLAIDRLQIAHQSKESEVESMELKLSATLKDKTQRDLLVDQVESSSKDLERLQKELAPMAEQVAALNQQKNAAHGEYKEVSTNLKSAREVLELAQDDHKHIEQVNSLNSALDQLKRLGGLQKQASQARSVANKIKVDANGVNALREAERQLQIATAKRDAVASEIELSAEIDLQLAWEDGQPIGMVKGDIERRSLASETILRIQDVASIRFSPSQSAAELEGELEQSQAALSTLLARYQVKNLAEAVAAEGIRADAERDLKKLNERMRELLGDDSEEDVASSAKTLQTECDAYIASRQAESKLPADLKSAAILLENAKNAFNRLEKQVEQKRAAFDELKDAFNEADADSRVKTQEIDGLEIDLKRRQTNLAELRSVEADEVVEERVADQTARLEGLKAELLTLTTQLENAMPEEAELVLSNSRAVLSRAENDLNDRRVKLAVLEDRLTSAQANGRFEELENAERNLEDLQAKYDSTISRAEAAHLLWKTLNKHRDATRQAYLRPLKDRIERLGKIVFGHGFTVEVGEDWTLLSRTLQDKTIPFEDLSVGAKEQLGILTRLAAAQIVSAEGGVPLIIDDALGFSDPGRLESMGAAISSAGKDCQIVLLTCTPGRFQNVGSAKVVRFESEISEVI